jgi:hypothetical protein
MVIATVDNLRIGGFLGGGSLELIRFLAAHLAIAYCVRLLAMPGNMVRDGPRADN